MSRRDGPTSKVLGLPELWGALREAEERLGRLWPLADELLDDEERASLRLVQEGQRALLARLEARLGMPKAAAVAAPPCIEDDPSRFRVLVVEDDPSLRTLMHDVLAPWFTVVEAEDGAQGAATWGPSGADVVVTDLFMPELDGFGLTEAIRRNPDGHTVPVIVLSGRSDPQMKVRAFEAGAFDYMVKPVDSQELVARIRNALIWSQHIKREQHLQLVDELTGVGNRRRLLSFLGDRVRRAERTGGSISVLMVDQDGLKRLNDAHGHSAGDAALKALAQTLSRVTRGGDLVARIGGDEFVVVLPDTSRQAAEVVVGRAREELARTILRLPSGPVRLSASFGLASTADAGCSESVERLLERADEALYAEKRDRVSRITG